MASGLVPTIQWRTSHILTTVMTARPKSTATTTLTGVEIFGNLN